LFTITELRFIMTINPVLMLVKLIPAWFLQPALASRVQMNLSPEPPCMFDCGASHMEVPYNGKMLKFLADQSKTYARCFTKCKATQMVRGTWNPFNNMLNQKSCRNILRGSTKVSWGKTEEGEYVKLCCTSRPCENKQKCQFPPSNKGISVEVNVGSSLTQLKFHLGYGENLDYQMPFGYCVKGCFVTVGHDLSNYKKSCRRGSESLRGHGAIATAESSGIFGTLCCVPMLIPKEKPNIGQTEQEMVVNPGSAREEEEEEMPDEIPDEDDEADAPQASNATAMHVGMLFSSEI